MRVRPAIALTLFVWLAATILLLASHWYASCTVDGHQLGGIDCLQGITVPRTGDAPARWFGFLPLAAVWAASGVLLLLARRARRSRPSGARRSGLHT